MLEQLVTSVVGGAIGGAIALAGQLLVQRRALTHRFGERLWEERVRAYQDFNVAVSDLSLGAIAKVCEGSEPLTSEQLVELLRGFIASLSRMQPIASRPVQDTTMDFWKGFLGLIGKDHKTVSEFCESKGLAIVNAMRQDLFIGRLDTRERLWGREEFVKYLRERGHLK